jgi:hypothetical protein
MNMYSYIGPEDIRKKWELAGTGSRITSKSDLERWIRKMAIKGDSSVVSTFIVSTDASPWLADR